MRAFYPTRHDVTATSPRTSTMSQIQSLLVTISPRLAPELLAKLSAAAANVHVYPIKEAAQPSPDVLASVDAIFTTVQGLPAYIADLSKQCPRLRLIQASSSGVTKIVESAGWKALTPQQAAKIAITNASGLHVITIPPWVITTTHMLYLRLNEQYLNAQTKATWIDSLPDHRGQVYAGRTVRGRTVGLLGYGHLGRETARLFKAFGARVIAANTRGTRSPDHGYVIPGTGDPDAQIPEAMFSTSEEASLRQFLQQSDVLVASLPSTPATRGFLSAERLALLPQDAVLINVGRGDVVQTETVLEALNRPLDQRNGPLWGFAADVTDPEPLPDGSPLYTHPRAIITPHLAGDSEGELETATDIAYNNLLRLGASQELLNVVDVAKGY